MQPQIVGLGLSTIDILMRIGDMPTWEAGGQPRELRMDGGGPVGTAMCAAARLGVQVGFIGTRGSDETARLKMDFLARDGVDTSRVVTRPGAEAQVVLCCVHETSGERVFLMAEHLAGVELRPEELDRDYITSAEFLELDGFHYAAALQAAQWMQSAGKTVVLDAGKSTGKVNNIMADLVGMTDVLICGAGFGAGLTGKTERWDVAEALQAMGPRVVVQTEGEDGSYTMTAGECFHTPAYAVGVVDTTGAGDVFHGAYLAGLARGWDARRCARYGAAAAALKCTRLGGRVGIPTHAEVLKFLRDRQVEEA